MIDDVTAQCFAADWLEAWNSHDLERIREHYDEEECFVSPAVGRAGGPERLAELWEAEKRPPGARTTWHR